MLNPFGLLHSASVK